MDPVVRLHPFGSQQRDRVARGYRWAQSQPSWIVRLAVLTFLLVVGLPILLLVMFAVLAASVVFGGLALFHTALGKLRGLPSHRDGRKNVRVIRRARPDS